MIGEEDRLDHLARHCGPRVLAYLVARSPNRDDACDVYARTLSTTWRRLVDVPPDDAAALAWMLGAARRELANHRRSEGRRSAATVRLAEYLRTAAPASSSGEDDRLADAVRALPSEQGELIELVYWHSLTCDQAAGVIGVRPATARKRLQRARDELRRVLVVAPT